MVLGVIPSRHLLRLFVEARTCLLYLDLPITGPHSSESGLVGPRHTQSPFLTLVSQGVSEMPFFCLFFTACWFTPTLSLIWMSGKPTLPASPLVSSLHFIQVPKLL